MTDAIAEAERIKYDDVWRSPRYRVKAHGLALWCRRRDLFPPIVMSAVDLGCGHGRLMAQWLQEGIDAVGVDLSAAAPDPDIAERWGHRLHFTSLWDLALGRRFQLGVCADVMEHIPEGQVARTLARVADHVDVAVFKIANHASRWLGHDLHPTQRPADWWRERLEVAFSAVERLPFEPAGRTFLFRCRC